MGPPGPAPALEGTGAPGMAAFGLPDREDGGGNAPQSGWTVTRAWREDIIRSGWLYRVKPSPPTYPLRRIPPRFAPAPSREGEVGEVREMMKGIPMWAPFRSISEEIRPVLRRIRPVVSISRSIAS